ncbi:hypothetical protein MHAE_19061, partial [Mycobacterium haemophilum DSM 44634]
MAGANAVAAELFSRASTVVSNHIRRACGAISAAQPRTASLTRAEQQDPQSPIAVTVARICSCSVMVSRRPRGGIGLACQVDHYAA